MKILFNDVVQYSDAPDELKSPALADCYPVDGEIEINFDKERDINCIGIGNTDGSNFEIGESEMEAGTVITESPLQIYNIRNICYGNGLFVAITDTSVFTSPDGITWTERDLPSPSLNLYRICYGNGLFVITEMYSGLTKILYVFTSPDGITWTEREVKSITSGTLHVNNICYGNGLFVAITRHYVNYLSDYKVQTSPDGITWTERDLPSPSLQRDHICYGNGLFVILCLNGYVNISTDGITWTEHTETNMLASNFLVADICYGNGLFVAVRGSNYNIVFTSPDGITWTRQNNILGAIRSLCYGNGLFFGVASNSGGYAYASPDGITWTNLYSTSRWGNVNCYGNEIFLAVNSGDNINLIAIIKYVKNEIFVPLFNITFDKNGLYKLNDNYKSDKLVIRTDATYIGRFAAGKYADIKTAIQKEPSYKSTNSPRITLSGQVVPGLGGYNYRTVSVDVRYKITREIFKEIEDAFYYISQGYPFFIDFTDESYKLPFDKLYANEKTQQSLGFEGGIHRFLYSRRWEFEERF